MQINYIGTKFVNRPELPENMMASDDYKTCILILSDSGQASILNLQIIEEILEYVPLFETDSQI